MSRGRLKSDPRSPSLRRRWSFTTVKGLRPVCIARRFMNRLPKFSKLKFLPGTTDLGCVGLRPPTVKAVTPHQKGAARKTKGPATNAKEVGVGNPAEENVLLPGLCSLN